MINTYFRKELKKPENILVRRAVIVNKLIAKGKIQLATKIICSAK